MYLILIETSGNQRYIFSTNKLRENVGASELTYRVGTKVVREAVNTVTGREVSENLEDERPIEQLTDNDAEVVIATSGKSLLLAKDINVAKKIVAEVTKNALIKMPGLTIHGAICEVKTDDTKNEAENFHQAVGDVHKRLEEIRYRVPSNLQRFQRIPFVAECHTSNLPAEKTYRHKVVEKVNEERPHSKVSIFKQEALFEGKERLETTIGKAEKELFPQDEPALYFDFEENKRRFDFANNPHRLDIEERFKNTKWFAVIHADGNGLGQTFLDFQKETGTETARDYIDKYRKLSLKLDQCTEKAVAYGLKKLQSEYLKNNKKKIDKKTFEVPAIPLILGGDDLTIICDGQYSIKFTTDFLTKFVEYTEKIEGVFAKEKKLGICAGIAIIKPHFPFHQAYDLAAELLQSAKKTKQISTSLSAFDYHVLYDSSGTKLEEIREKTPFVVRPYVVTELGKAKGFVDLNTGENRRKSDDQKVVEKDWIKNHHFDELAKRVEAMSADENDETRKLPNSQLHVLREGLFVADTTADIQKETDARAKLIAHRYKDKGFDKLLNDGESLFFKEDGEYLTHFLDALDVVEFWK